MRASQVSDVRFTPASDADVATGLLGYIRCNYGDTLVLDGIALRRTLAGRWTLAFPSKRDRAGRPHPYIRPRDGAARAAIEAALLQALGIAPEGAS